MSTQKKLMIVSNRLPCVVESVNGRMQLERASGGLMSLP